MNAKTELQAVMIDTGEDLDREEFIKFVYDNVQYLEFIK